MQNIHSFIHSFSQSVSQSVSQLVSQPASQPASQLAGISQFSQSSRDWEMQLDQDLLKKEEEIIKVALLTIGHESKKSFVFYEDLAKRLLKSMDSQEFWYPENVWAIRVKYLNSIVNKMNNIKSLMIDM